MILRSLPTVTAGLLLCAACTPPAAEPPPAEPDTELVALERALADIAERAGEGARVGVAAVHLETDARVALNGGEPFAMMSSYKFPIALAVLRKVEEGALRLDQPVRFGPGDLRAGHSPVAERHPDGGELPLRELVRLSVEESDNTASDLLFRLLGGDEPITAYLRALGVEGVRVDREEGLLTAHYYGIDTADTVSPTRAEVRAALPAVPPERRREAATRFPLDPRDTATPEGMAALLIAFEEGRALGPEMRGVLREMMVRTPTGRNRLKALLPAGTEVAHKTGTSDDYEGIVAAVNDVGIVTLPDGRGRVAIAVFVRNARGLQAAEEVIARTARAVCDHWAGMRETG